MCDDQKDFATLIELEPVFPVPEMEARLGSIIFQEFVCSGFKFIPSRIGLRSSALVFDCLWVDKEEILLQIHDT